MSWREDAACLGEPTEWWFPEPGDQPDARAIYLCTGVCPVRDECEAASATERHGWWAGIDRHKRRRGAPTVVVVPIEQLHPGTQRWLAEQLRLAL
jgi:hypothetical protein